MSAVTVTVSVAVLPAASIATTVMVLMPLMRDTVVLNEPFFRSTELLLTVKPVTPMLSDAVPVTLTLEVVTVEPLAGAVMTMAGGMSSITSKVIFTLVLELPTLSVALSGR